MKKDTLKRIVAKKTGVLLEVVDLVCNMFIDEIKETVERGETVRINEFMQIYLHEKKDYRASAFVRKDGETNGGEFKGRILVKGRKVPWVKVSRTWRRSVIAKQTSITVNNDKGQN